MMKTILSVIFSVFLLACMNSPELKQAEDNISYASKSVCLKHGDQIFSALKAIQDSSDVRYSGVYIAHDSLHMHLEQSRDKEKFAKLLNRTEEEYMMDMQSDRREILNKGQFHQIIWSEISDLVFFYETKEIGGLHLLKGKLQFNMGAHTYMLTSYSLFTGSKYRLYRMVM